jgi:hypothetical protein
MTPATAALPKAHQEKSEAPESRKRSPKPLAGRPDAFGEHGMRCGAVRGEAKNDQSRAELLGFCRSCRPAIEQKIMVLEGERLKQWEESCA